MKTTLIIFFALIADTSIVSGQVQVTNPGAVLFERYANPPLDVYDVAPNASQEQWFRNSFFRIDVFSPYFDSRTAWYPRALVYLNVYGVDPADPLVAQHPDRIMHDSSGNLLWIPFACDTVTCAKYAGDFSNPNFRAWWIANAASTLAHGYFGFALDDVDMDMGASNAYYGQLPPIDYSTGQPMTPDVWRSEMAGFLEQIRQAFPGIEILHNSVWYANTACCWPDFATPLDRDLDPNIQRQIAAADVIDKEAGVASDLGLQGGTGVWSLNSLFGYIDRVHAAGKHVTMAEYTLDRPGQEYALAGYFLISNGGDRYGDRSTTPNNYWNGFTVNLGNPYSARVYHNGLFQRNFTGGVVLLNDPWAPTGTVVLSEPSTRLDGSVVTSVTLGPRQGAILLGAGAPGKWVSDLNWTYVVNGRGPVQHDTSTNGNTLSLNGNKYLKGLGANAYSEIHYDLAANPCGRFTATVGVDDEVPPGAGSVDFQVWADNIFLFDSGHMVGGSPVQAVDVNVSGHTTLELFVSDGGYGNGNSHADWANARLECQ